MQLLPLLALVLAATSVQALAAPVSCNVTYIVYGDPRCPHCKALLAVLDAVAPGCYEFRNIAAEEEARREYVELWRSVVGGSGYLIPFTVVEVDGKRVAYIVGEVDARGLEEIVAKASASERPLLCIGVDCRPVMPRQPPELAVPADRLGLAAAVAGLALLDSVNPCFLALYTALVAAAALRGRGLAAGLAVTAGVFTGYFSLGLGLAGALSALGQQVRPVMGLAAAALGAYMIAGRRGDRCRICERVAGLATSSPLVWFGFGLTASLTLLPCTAGPYVVAIALLHGLSMPEKLAYLVLYNLVFVSPLLAICAGASRLGSIAAARARLLELASGALLVALGAAIAAGLV